MKPQVTPQISPASCRCQWIASKRSSCRRAAWAWIKHNPSPSLSPNTPFLFLIQACCSWTWQGSACENKVWWARHLRPGPRIRRVGSPQKDEGLSQILIEIHAQYESTQIGLTDQMSICQSVPDVTCDCRVLCLRFAYQNCIVCDTTFVLCRPRITWAQLTVQWQVLLAHLRITRRGW